VNECISAREETEKSRRTELERVLERNDRNKTDYGTSRSD